MPFKSSFKAILHFFLYPFSPKSVWSEEGYVGKQNIQFTSYFSSKPVKYYDSPWEGTGRHKCLIPGHVLSTGHTRNQSWMRFRLRPLSLSCMVLLGWICTCFSFIRKLPPWGLPLTYTLSSSEASIKPHSSLPSGTGAFYVSVLITRRMCFHASLIDILVLFLLLKKRRTHPVSSGTRSRALSSFAYLGNRFYPLP